MIADFWRYRVLKTGRKAVWLPYARLRAALHGRSPATRRSGRTAYGVNMVQHWHDRTFVYCHAGIYGRFLADEIMRRQEPFVFVDIGANQGLYSAIAVRNPACRGAIAFEPVASTYAILEENIALNGAADRVRALRLGISDRAGSASIHVPAGHSGMASLASDAKPAKHGETEVIQTVAAAGLDQLLAGELPLLVKIDVEGHEATVIRELLTSAAGARVEAIFYEIDTRWSAAETIVEMLRAAGFTHFRKVGSGHHFDMLAQRAAVKGRGMTDQKGGGRTFFLGLEPRTR
jgi:FkbM family methyltransferase